MEFSHKKLNLSCPENGQSLEQTSYDWLSNLPPDIQLRILSFLNMTEVVKTSFLSRKWRFIWSSIPCLNFDFRDFGNQEHCFALSYDECISKFWVFVKRTIIMRDRDPSPIYKIQFSYDYFNAYLLELLISLCATRNVPELVLVAGFGSKKCPLYCDAPRSINVIAQNLNNLKLEPFTSFGNLKTLHLVRVGFPDTDVTENLFGDCGILENLSIEYCCFMMIKFLNIRANKLRMLHFLNNGPSWCRSMCRFEGALKLQTPNLESFCYIGPAIHFCEFSDMLFLKHALIRVRCENYQLVPCHKLDTIVSVINDVEELSMSSVFAMVCVYSLIFYIIALVAVPFCLTNIGFLGTSGITDDIF